jgi:hypothetical protein
VNVAIDNRNLGSLRMGGGYGDSRNASEECPAIDSNYIFGIGHVYHSIPRAANSIQDRIN